MASRSSPKPFTVVFVCTANRARSALAAELLRRRTFVTAVDVSSRGTLDVGAAPVLTEMALAARGLGIDLSKHRATPLARGELADADLVLGFEPFHVAVAVVDGAAPPANAFTLRELVELCDEGAGAGARDRPAAVIRAAHERRAGRRRLDAPSIPDPLGKPRSVFVGLARDLDRVVARMAAQVFGTDESR